MPAKVKVFVMGRPGSGKTTAVRRLMRLAEERDWGATRIKDYNILYSMFQAEADTGYKRFRPTNHGGFDVVDFAVLDIALEQLEKIAKKQESRKSLKDELIIIEFARNDYREALKCFKPDFLRTSHFFFVDAELEICIGRIRKRMVCPVEDNHYVSEHIIKSYYNKDNWEYMDRYLKEDYAIEKRRIETVYNMGSLQEFIDDVDRFANTTFWQEVHKIEVAPALQQILVEQNTTMLEAAGLSPSPITFVTSI